MSLRTIAMTVIPLLLMLGCDQKPASKAPASSPATQVAMIKAPCVICVDHELDVDASTAFTDYEGKRYYFCSDHCKQKFSQDPGKALATFEKRKGHPPQTR